MNTKNRLQISNNTFSLNTRTDKLNLSSQASENFNNYFVCKKLNWQSH